MAESNVDLQALRGRDRSAWALLYDSLVHGTYGLVWKLTGGDRTTCEDLNQEIWLSAIDSIEKFDAQRGTIKSWIFGIARFKALQHLRQAYGFCIVQKTEPVFRKDNGSRELAYTNTEIFDDFRQSPSGFWYPRRNRRTTSNSDVTQVREYYVDFQANLADSLFVPLDLNE